MSSLNARAGWKFTSGNRLGEVTTPIFSGDGTELKARVGNVYSIFTFYRPLRLPT